MRILITGGAGFIGVNAACRFIKEGHAVSVLDNLSRVGSRLNLAWLRRQGGFTFLNLDVRDMRRTAEALRRSRFDAILHLAGQVAVTTSVGDPFFDFEANARGTFGVLEAMRKFRPEAILLFASTNKVYGALPGVPVTRRKSRYHCPTLPYGVSERQPLDFLSPYGCSKGAADQYVIDYGRTYGLRTLALRQSCIYGPHQLGVEDQGWVAWFVIATILKRRLTIYGDGLQVRDLLFVDDLVDLYSTILSRGRSWARAYNVGGGPHNTLSPRELLHRLEALGGTGHEVCYADWRTGDQRVYISDIREAQAAFGWAPKISVERGLRLLYDWVVRHQKTLSRLFPL